MSIKSSSFIAKRRFIIRFAGWFFLANILLLLLIGLNYARMVPSFAEDTLASSGGVIFAYVFLGVSFVAQFTIVSFVAYCVTLLVILLCPKRFIVLLIAVLLSAALSVFFMADSIVYHLYHLHLAGVVWQIVWQGVAGDILVLSYLEWLIALGFIFAFLAVEVALAFFIWKKLQRSSGKGIGYIIAAILSFIVLASYTTYLTALTTKTNEGVYLSNIHLLEIDAQFIPYYNEVLSLFIPKKHSRLFLQLVGGGYFYQPPQVTKPLNYPHHPIQCIRKKRPLNLVVILLDAWRFDMFNAVNTPNIYRFSKNADIFRHHFSGGNSTGPGVFSLFYSLPYTYWTSVLKQGRSPILIDELLKQRYQIGIFSSGSLHYPAFDETVFRNIKPLRIEAPGKYSYQRDQRSTQDFNRFLKNVSDQKPFFGFIFYDTSHNYCQNPSAYPNPFKPSWRICNRITLSSNTNRQRFFNVYKNAVYAVDQLVSKVLKTLRKEKLLENTVVIITADHGEQFNDNRKGIWGHASDYTRWQLHVPLILYLPNKTRHVVNDYTTHYDIVPFIMRRLFGCSNAIQDYSIGAPLFMPRKQLNLFAASYVDYAFVQNDHITRIYPSGSIRIYNNQGEDIRGASLSPQMAKNFFKTMNEYYKEPKKA